MIFTYSPQGQPEREWTFKPSKLMSPEAEAIERVTRMDFAGEFGAKLLSGSMLARRALVWIFLRREQPTLRFDDVSVCMDDTGMRYDGDELAAMAARRGDVAPEQAQLIDKVLAAHGFDPAAQVATDPTQAAAAAS